MPRKRGRPTQAESLLIAKEPFIQALQDACKTSRRAGTADERNRAAEDAFFRAAAALEAFLSEWIIRCVSFDSAALRRRYQEKAENAARSALWTGWEPAKRLWASQESPDVGVSFTLPKRHSLEGTIKLLGRDDDNLSFADAHAFRETALNVVPSKYAKRVKELSAQDERVLDATIAMRNVIAHRSQRSTTRMNQILGSAQLPTGLRRAQQAVSAKGVGFYLRSEGAAGRPRCEVFYDELAGISHLLAPKAGPRPSICP